MAATVRLDTADDLWEMPGDEPWEIWGGELRGVGGAGGRASNLAGEIFSLIRPFVRAGKLGLLTGADGAYIVARDPDTVLVPDVGFVRWNHLPNRRAPERFIPVAPDLAVEVGSPSDTPRDVAAKMALYRRAGVPLVWWVYPDRRTVTVYRDGEDLGAFGEGDDLDGGEVLPGFRLAVAEIFAEV